MTLLLTFTFGLYLSIFNSFDICRGGVGDWASDVSQEALVIFLQEMRNHRCSLRDSVDVNNEFSPFKCGQCDIA